jgi:glycosyl hydrolase family 39 (putative alpha-L-iduronidase)
MKYFQYSFLENFNSFIFFVQEFNMTNRYLKISLLCLTLFSFILYSAVCREPEATAVIDWTRTDGIVNRALFSTQGFMQIYKCDDPMVMDTFKLTNPHDTQTRLETYIHQMEPVNDNDDPNVMNWAKMYPQKMIRFIDDRKSFENELDSQGIETLSLLCYLAPWLKSEDIENPIKDIDEWVEFACAVIESYNGKGEDYRPILRYVEIWNEPNMEMFYTGSMESYFKLFNAAADRIHRDYPGVMVGGPASCLALQTRGMDAGIY